MATFADVKAILDEAIAQWKTQHGREPNLTGRHGANFGWDTKQKLAEAVARGRRLIEPDKVGNGRAEETNLVVALRAGVAPFSRMPSGGPFLVDARIAEVARWIDAGMPD